MSEAPLSLEAAVELYLARRRAGEREGASLFAARHAHLGPELREALEAVDVLESAGAAADGLPERIGPYRVVRELGRGGMGVVLEAVDEALGRRVALKLILPELLASASARARFRREAELAARLDHPGIAAVYGTGLDGERPWIALRYVAGRTLAEAIADARERGLACVALDPRHRGRAATLRLAELLARAARALQAAHEAGVVHRDVKPSNLVVAPDGTPVLLDFGLALGEQPEGQSRTRSGDTAGTPAYLAPELIEGARARPDAQCDVYALGVTIHECLALRRPFEAPTHAALYRAILAGARPSLRSLNPHVSRDLEVVVATALEREPARRYASAAALAEDLEACVAGRPIAARPLSLAGRAVRWARREPRQAALAGLLLVATLAAAVSAGTWWSSRSIVRAAERTRRASALEAALGEGFALLGEREARLADLALGGALALDPGCVEARVGRVLASLDAGRAEEARARLAELPADTPGLEPLRALLERPRLDLREPPPAPEVTALELAIRGLCWQHQASRTPFHERQPVHARALECFEEAILRSPVVRPLYLEQRAMAAQGAGEHAEARSCAATLLRLWPDSPEALYAAGRALYPTDLAGARDALERSLALRPRYVDAWVLLGMTLCDLGEAEEAERCCWRGLALDPTKGNLNLLLGQSLVMRECAAEARVAYGRAVAHDPTLATAWAQLATLDLIEGDAERACTLFGRALAADPGAARRRIFYAAALERAGLLDEARAQRDEALASLVPGDPAYWTTLSWTFLYVQAPHAALAAAETGLALQPEEPGLLERRAAALQELARAR